jgi:hypothetical protein
VLKCIEGCQCSIGTVSCRNGLSVNESKGSNRNYRASEEGAELTILI